VPSPALPRQRRTPRLRPWHLPRPKWQCSLPTSWPPHAARTRW